MPRATKAARSDHILCTSLSLSVDEDKRVPHDSPDHRLGDGARVVKDKVWKEDALLVSLRRSHAQSLRLHLVEMNHAVQIVYPWHVASLRLTCEYMEILQNMGSGSNESLLLESYSATRATYVTLESAV